MAAGDSLLGTCQRFPGVTVAIRLLCLKLIWILRVKVRDTAKGFSQQFQFFIVNTGRFRGLSLLAQHANPSFDNRSHR